MSFSLFRVILIGWTGVIFWFFINQYYFNTINENTDIQTWTGDYDVFSSEKIEDAKKIIQNEYYHFSDKTKQEIEDGMLKSIVESLGDKHSSYFNPKEAKDFSEVLRGDFEWIGAVIDEHMKWIIIRKVFDTSPAKKSWLQDGDIIIKVWDESMVWMKSEDAVKKIRWPKGSKVTLSYIRWDDESNTVEVTRDTIIIPSVQGRILSWSTIGYIEVAFFWDKTTDEFKKSLQDIIRSGAQSIILDFRDNGGWFLETAVDILSYFIPEGSLAVKTRENNPKNTLDLRTKNSNSKYYNIPIVMIINNLSASATEIVAWALQDYKRAIIVWEKSYGKWSVQEPFVLDDGSILKITIGRWYTPNDQNIDKNGISPDITVPLFEKDYINQYDRQLKAAEEIMSFYTDSELSFTWVLEKAKTIDFTK
jgi:carboxyl-terminal processing protease